MTKFATAAAPASAPVYARTEQKCAMFLPGYPTCGCAAGFAAFAVFFSENTAKGDACPTPGLLFLLFFAVWRTGESAASCARQSDSSWTGRFPNCDSENKSPPNGGNRSVSRIAELCSFSNFIDA
jgi:hypothetical protein